MIEAKNLTKKFDSIVAVDHIDARIKDGCVFGLIGTNGAGKSTFLRMACGVLKPDEGTIQIDGEDVYENAKVKGRFFYISDDQYFFGNGTPQELMAQPWAFNSEMRFSSRSFEAAMMASGKPASANILWASFDK